MTPSTSSTGRLTRKFSSLRTQIADVPVVELARQFGTPLYVYDAAQIAKRVDDLAAFDVVRYAQKACSNLAIVDLIRRLGCLVDAVSAGEIHRAIAAGYEPAGEPPPIVYTADIFDHESLDLVVEHRIHPNLGSPDMIAQLGQRLSPERPKTASEITLRINPGFGHGHSQKTNTGGEQSKHGIWHEEVPDCLRQAEQHGLHVTGIHMHIGSGTDLKHLTQVCGALEKIALQVGPSVRSISAGGGLPTPYRESDETVDIPAYFELWNRTRKRLEDQFNHPLSLEIEPGRYLTAESGYLVAEIRAIKSMGKNLFYLLDAGFNDLARPILYGSYHPMSIVPADDGRSNKDDGNKEGRTIDMQQVVVGGPLCESGDIFTQDEGGFVAHRKLPRAEVGQLIVIECAGAYGSVMASNYNSKPLPAELLIQNGKTHLIRSRQTFEDMIQQEKIPH